MLLCKGDSNTIAQASVKRGRYGILIFSLTNQYIIYDNQWLAKNGVSFEPGDVFIIAASFCTVFSNVISKKVFSKVSPITSTGVSQLFGGIVLVIIGASLGGNVSFAYSLWIMAYICVASIFSYCIWFGTVKNSELSKLFIIKFAEPVFSAAFGAIILGDNILRIEYLIAFALISIRVIVSHSNKKTKITVK